MLDIRFIRENPDAVRENIKKKFQDSKLPLVDEVIDLDAKRRAAIAEADQLEPEKISEEISKLYPVYQEILKLAEIVRETNNMDILIEYIDKCIELKCRLVEIHPFVDGNGRTFRALVNLLFRKVGLPPIYVKKAEKSEYIEAMDRAIRLKDTSSIKKFYYYKICDSIVELDISERQKEDEKIKSKIS